MKKVLDSFMNECSDDFEEYIKKHKEKKIKERTDYDKLKIEKNKLLSNYPRVKKFVEKDKIDEFSLEEIIAILKFIKLMKQEYKLDLKECFKLGAKEAYIFYEEQDMLNI